MTRPVGRPRLYVGMTCSAPECAEPPAARGLCRKHYQQARKAGALRAQPESGSRMVDLGEAASYLNVTSSWMRHAVRVRRLPYYKLGNVLRFNTQDLDEYLRSVRVEASS